MTTWSRLMVKEIKEGIIEEKFQFRDIRAKAGSGSKGGRLGHTNWATLNRYYKQLPRRVSPTK